MIGIQEKTSNIDLRGMKMEIKKVISTEPPPHIAEFLIYIWALQAIDEKDQGRLESAASRCPVIESLHPDIEQKITFHWKDGS